MAAPKGNQYWKLHKKPMGPKPKFKTPEELWEKCRDYFQWVEDNPLPELKVFHYQGDIVEHNVPKMRAMSINGLCLFLNITMETWRTWRETREDLSAIITHVESAIFSQKFEGASADLLNANIIARDLGLADKKELGGPDGGAIPIKDESRVEFGRKVAFLLAEAVQSVGKDDA